MYNLIEFSALILGTVSTLLPIANPFSTAPVFASLTSYMAPEERNRQARLSAFYMIGILIVTLFLGAIILSFFGISIPAVRVAGGILIAKIGLSMVSSESESPISDEHKSESFIKKDIAFVPVAMPLLSGPGSMAVTLGMASHSDNIYDYMGVGFGIVLVAFISWLILRFSNQVAAFLGTTGLDALTKVMGFLLLSVGVTFIFQGILEGLINPDVIGPIVRVIQSI